MIRRFFYALLACLPLTAFAQDAVPTTPLFPDAVTVDSLAEPTPADSVAPAIRFGFLSYDKVLKSMPDYEVAQDSIRAEQEAYAKEMKRVEDEFNRKYESFLEGQQDFPRTILLKRQTELQEMMQRNVAFKAQARADLQAAEERYLAPVRARLNTAIAELAKEYRLAFVLNTDGYACPFIDPVFGIDLQALAIEYLK